MSRLSLVKLASRKLLRVSGPDTYPYLQGLLCNDLRLLYDRERILQRSHAQVTRNVISSYMLNAQGRAICDMLLYRTAQTRDECDFTPPGKASDHDELFIECDQTLASGLANTLYGYRVRRKINISMEKDLAVWCLYKDSVTKSTAYPGHKLTEIIPTTSELELSRVVDQVEPELIIVPDPRLATLGLRVVTSSSNDFIALTKILKTTLKQEIDIKQVNIGEYNQHRYALGVGEGPADHPESNCLPLECNADFLGSVSFNKGCYLGQELTARIHYTGVVRKRLVPIVIEALKGDIQPGQAPLLAGSEIVTQDEKSAKIGVVRHVSKGHGLALIRHEKIVNGETQFMHHASQTKVTAYIPYWWNNNTIHP